MHKNDEIEDINVWEPKDPKKPYLIWKEGGNLFVSTKILTEDNYLQKWRENHCEQVSADEFEVKLKHFEDRVKKPRKEFMKRCEIQSKYINFGGLVLPKGVRRNASYDFAIFLDGAEFILKQPRGEFKELQYDFVGVKFQGCFTFSEESEFSSYSPFIYATICKKSYLTISGDAGCIFKYRDKSQLQEPFAGLKIEEEGGINFKHCKFNDIFTLRNLNLKHSFFCGSNIEKIRFINCIFDEEKGGFFTPARLTLADENLKKLQKLIEKFRENHELVIPEYEKPPKNKELAVMYQLMKKSFEDQKDYQTAGKFYVSEMVFRQKEATGIRKRFLFLYGFLAGYGESIWRTGVLLVLFILFSIFLYRFSTDSWQLAANQTFSSLLLFKNTDDIIFADILSRLLFIPAIFLFLNAIRRRLRRS